MSFSIAFDFNISTSHTVTSSFSFRVIRDFIGYIIYISHANFKCNYYALCIQIATTAIPKKDSDSLV